MHILINNFLENIKKVQFGKVQFGLQFECFLQQTVENGENLTPNGPMLLFT